MLLWRQQQHLLSAEQRAFIAPRGQIGEPGPHPGGKKETAGPLLRAGRC
jgi:hypothetical protein